MRSLCNSTEDSMLVFELRVMEMGGIIERVQLGRFFVCCFLTRWGTCDVSEDMLSVGDSLWRGEDIWKHVTGCSQRWGLQQQLTILDDGGEGGVLAICEGIDSCLL